MTNPLDDFMGGGGAKSFAFTQIGSSVTGLITKLPEKKQQTDLKTGKPRFFQDSGEPMWVYVLEIQTNLRDPMDPQDDGRRSLWLKGGKWDAHRGVGASLRAVQEAIRASGAKLPQLGGELTLFYACDGPGARGEQPPKYYGARYVPGSAGGFMDTGTSGVVPTSVSYTPPQQIQYPQQQVQGYGQQGGQNYAQPAQQLPPPPVPPTPATAEQQAIMAQLAAQQQRAVSILGQASPNQSDGPAPF